MHGGLVPLQILIGYLVLCVLVIDNARSRRHVTLIMPSLFRFFPFFLVAGG